MAKIYVASRWRNPYQPEVVAALRKAGYEVYDFRNPKDNPGGFHWADAIFFRNFAEDMEQKGLTKKQFQIQMVSMALYTLMAVYWIVSGARSGDTFLWILGAVYLAFIIAYSVYLIIHYKRHPVEDPELDRKAVENFKTGTKGMALVLGIIAVGFMIAFGLAALLK